MYRTFIILSYVLSLLIPSIYANFSGYVVKVIDGDTLVVIKTNNQRVKVRLVDIDAPEIGQPYSQKSKNSLIELSAHKNADIKSQGHDVYGRVLGMVFIAGKNINEEQVRRGYAWAYQFKGQVNNSYFKQLQQAAKQARQGLWRSKNPIAPWDWRRNYH